ncbi:MAG TPA: anti-sigma factor [Gaiellaceae bacterium]
MDRYASLIPGYALDALGDDERRELEGHLPACETCRAELRAHREAAASLSYALVPEEPPAALRDAIVRRARDELAREAPPRRRARLPRLPRLAVLAPAAALAAAAAAAAVVLIASRGPDNGWIRTSTDRIALSGGKGVVVVSGSRGALVTSLADAPAGHTYEAWVVRGKRPVAAGTFRRGGGAFVLRAPVRRGDVVAVTVEPGDGSDAPTTTPILRATVA